MTQHTTWIIPTTIDRAQFESFLQQQGLELAFATSRSAIEMVQRIWHSIDNTEWIYTENHHLGIRALTTTSASDDARALAISQEFGLLGFKRLMHNALEAHTNRALIQSLNELVGWASMSELQALEQDFVNILEQRLQSDNVAIQLAAITAASYLDYPEVDALLSRFEQREHLVTVIGWVRAMWNEDRQGILGDFQTTNTEVLYDRAHLGIEHGQWLRTVQACDELIEMSQLNQEVFLWRAEAYSHMQQPWASLADYLAVQNLTDADDEHSQKIFTLAQDRIQPLIAEVTNKSISELALENIFQLAVFDRTHATTLLEQVSRIAPESDRAVTQLAGFFLQIDLHDNSPESLVRLALQSEPRSALAWSTLSRVLENQGDYEAALDANIRAMELLPTIYDHELDGRFHNLIAKTWWPEATTLYEARYGLFIAMEQDEKALETTREWTQADPLYYRSWMIHGMALTSQGHTEQAIHAYDRAIELEATICDDEFALGISPLANAYYYRACERVALGDYDAVYTDIEHAVALDPNFAEEAMYEEPFSPLIELTPFREAIARGIERLPEEPSDEETLQYFRDVVYDTVNRWVGVVPSTTLIRTETMLVDFIDALEFTHDHSIHEARAIDIINTLQRDYQQVDDSRFQAAHDDFALILDELNVALVLEELDVPSLFGIETN